MTVPYLNAAHFVRAEAEQIADPVLFGETKAPEPGPREAATRDAYLIFATPQGQVVLNDLIERYLAAPVFVGGRDASLGFERNGENNVVRAIIERLQRAQQSIEQRRG